MGRPLADTTILYGRVSAGVRYRLAVQQLAHEVGLAKCQERTFVGLPGSIGIWCWVDLTIKAAEEEKKKGTWPWNIPNIETVRRLINYLADPKEIDAGVPRPPDSPPKWIHLKLDYPDVDPRTGHVRRQSTYRPVDISPAEGG